MKDRQIAISVTDRLAALSEPIRLRLLRLLERQELGVGEVAKVVQLPQSTVSRHLKVLSGAGWVEKRAEGTATLYRLVLDELPRNARNLWVTVREEVENDPAAEEDLHRLGAVLAERRTDTISYFGRVAGEWDAVRAELFGGGFTAPALLAMLPHDWVVADLGCGTGNGAELIAPHVREVVAVDQSGPMLEAARKRLAGLRNVRFLQGSLEAIPLGDSSVDSAMGLLVLHHVAEPVAALREMRRIVRPGGSALVVDMFAHDRTIYRQSMGHAHLGFSAQEMTEMFEAAGFTRPTISHLPSDPQAKGPGLFVAIGWRPDGRHQP